MEFDKFDIARNALCGAISLYIFTPYQSAAHVLAGACIDIVNALMPAPSKTQRRKAARYSKSLLKFCTNAGMTKEECKSINDSLRYCYTFLKHADEDPSESIEIKPKLTECCIFLAIRDYMSLRKGLPIEAQIFELWFLSINPQKVEKERNDYLERINLFFPNIKDCNHEQQKEQCKKMIMNKFGNPSLEMNEAKPSPYP